MNKPPSSSLLALSLCFVALLAACESGGGPNAVTIRYAGDTTAYGIFIRTIDPPTDALVAATDEEEGSPCHLTETARDAGCEFSGGQFPGDDVLLQLRGCYIEDGDALLDCELTSAQVAKLQSSAEVSTGCGCENCPTSPGFALCDVDSLDCDEAVISLQATADSATNAQAVPTTVHLEAETTCSTCCDTDFVPAGEIRMSSAQQVTEIVLELTLFGTCTLNDADCQVVEGDVSSVGSIVSPPVTTQRICIAAVDPFDPSIDLPLIACKEDTIAKATVIRALDKNYEPLTELPTITID